VAFVACGPGLEGLLAAELGELGHAARVTPGGAEVRTDQAGLWQVCWQSRLAESVRVRLKPFVARDFDSLVRELGRLPWRAYVPPGGSFGVSVTCHKSRLWHSDAVAERVAEVLRTRAGAVLWQPSAQGPSEDPEPDLRVFVRLQRDRVQVSIDAGGPRMHRRGYRTHVARASLRETLAAALVRVGRDAAPNARTLWDPFCGAGTIGLEWLEAQWGRPAGARRRFAFERWPTHVEDAYRRWVERVVHEAKTAPPVSYRVIGSDQSSQNLDAARANAAAAGASEVCEWICGDFEEVAGRIPEGALVITNPPYGVRLRAGDGRGDLLTRWGRLLQRRRDLRPVVQLLPTAARVAVGAHRIESVFRTSNGGIPVAAQLLR
jgi:putative N6-adenine-specific DNA methylase